MFPNRDKHIGSFFAFLLTGMTVICFTGCDYVPPIDLKIPPRVDVSYQTVSMLSATGQTPRMQADRGKTRLDFGQGPGGLVFKLDGKALQQKLGLPDLSKLDFGTQAMADCRTAECLAKDPEYRELIRSQKLSQFKLATGTLEVGETKLELKVNAYTLAEDLSYALELVGMAANTRIRLTGTTFDKDGNVMGNLSYNQIITEKVDTVTLERLLGEIQAGVK